RSPAAARSPSSPGPSTVTMPGPTSSMSTPSARSTPMVLRLSSPPESPRTVARPCANAANSTERWPIDLSPGTRTSPPSAPPGLRSAPAGPPPAAGARRAARPPLLPLPRSLHGSALAQQPLHLRQAGHQLIDPRFPQSIGHVYLPVLGDDDEWIDIRHQPQEP